MKHISPQYLYESITRRQYLDLMQDVRSKNYKREFISIPHITKCFSELINSGNINIEWQSYGISISRIYKFANLRSFISELPDEWFLVKVTKDYKDECYKCDQIDGLIDCLKKIYKI